MRVKFFAPHPGFAGATIPLPKEIKAAIDTLDGQEFSLDDALTKLRTAIIATDIKAKLEVADKFLFIVGHGAIFLRMTEKDTPQKMHVFRLISFRLAP